MKNQHGDLSELLTCTHCEKIFITKAQLNNHEVLHTDPTINCNQCGKLFHVQKNLKRHILSLHTDNSILPVHCTVCSKGLIDSTILKDHMNEHLGLMPYKCKYCSNVYQNASNRINHEKKFHWDLYTQGNHLMGGEKIKDIDQDGSDQ